MGHLGTARTGVLLDRGGAIAAVELLDEPLTLRFGAAALLMGIGVWLHLTEHHEHDWGTAHARWL